MMIELLLRRRPVVIAATGLSIQGDCRSLAAVALGSDHQKELFNPVCLSGLHCSNRRFVCASLTTLHNGVS